MNRIFGAIGGLALALGAASGTAWAAPPGSQRQTTERLDGTFASTSAGGVHYRVDLVAERWSQDGETAMWMEANVAAFDQNGGLIDECGDGHEVDPQLLEEFDADDLMHGFLHGTFDSGCFWESLSLDAHWFGDGMVLLGNSHDRDPGYVCSSHDEQRQAIIQANFGLGQGPEGPVAIYELDVDETRTGIISLIEAACHATGSPGPA